MLFRNNGNSYTACTQICVFVCVCVCVCVFMYIYIYIYIYIYTHTHTHTYILHNIDTLVAINKKKINWDSSEYRVPRISFPVPEVRNPWLIVYSAQGQYLALHICYRTFAAWFQVSSPQFRLYPPAFQTPSPHLRFNPRISGSIFAYEVLSTDLRAYLHTWKHHLRPHLMLCSRIWGIISHI